MSEEAERIEEAIIRCRRLEEEAAARAREGLPNDIALAQGEVNAAAHIRELLEEKLPDGPEWPFSSWNCELTFETNNNALYVSNLPNNVHEWDYSEIKVALDIGIAQRVEVEVLDGTRVDRD